MYSGNRSHFSIKKNEACDALITEFGKKTLENQYLQPGESYQDLFVRVAKVFADDEAHAQRMYDYMSQFWFMPATPILANGGTKNGLPISCFLNEADDSLESIIDLWVENAWLSSRGGGIGSYWGNLRSISEKVRNNGRSVGIMPFIKVMESLSLAIDQGSLRRGAAATYIPVDHPEIEEFIELRKPNGGDLNRKALYLHHGVILTDAFMHAVEKAATWDLKSPVTGETVKQISAVSLWIRLLNARMETGEPYIIFIDEVNRRIPEHHKEKNMWVKTSNLCTEITLPTGRDYNNKQRTAVCCLGSLNVEKFLLWRDHPTIIEDVCRFLDNTLTFFIENAPSGMHRAIYSASMERSIGLGMMGLHSFFQSLSLPWESAIAKSWNTHIAKHIRTKAEEASILLAEERGACADAAICGVQQRFSNKTSIAPTASISIICGGTSPGIEPIVSNMFTHKTLSGSFFVRNRFLEKVLEAKGLNIPEVWSDIAAHKGSVQHMDALSSHEKMVFKTAFEIDQRWLIDFAADRQPYICQSQSLNIFMDSTVHKQALHDVHWMAWKRGLKGMYYLRSSSVQRAENHVSAKKSFQQSSPVTEQAVPAYEECLSCQ